MTDQLDPLRYMDNDSLVRLCRHCAQKLDLWMEWKSNHNLYDHATSAPCDECQGANLRDPERCFTVRLRKPNDQAHGAAGARNQHKQTDYMPKKKTSKTPSAPAVDRAAPCSLTPRTDAVVASLPQNERGEITFAGIRSLIKLCEALEIELSANATAQTPPDSGTKDHE